MSEQQEPQSKNRAERRALDRKPKGSGPKIQKKRWVRT